MFFKSFTCTSYVLNTVFDFIYDKNKRKTPVTIIFLIICTKRTILLPSLIKSGAMVTILRLNDGLILNTFQKAAA